MNICLCCDKNESSDQLGVGEEVNYTICDDCRNGIIGDVSEEDTIKKARVVYDNGMKWDDVLSFFDLTILELEDQIKIFKEFGIKKKVIEELYESWEGSNDGA